MAIAARIAMIATAIINSIKVNPRDAMHWILLQATKCKKHGVQAQAGPADERGGSQGER